ncbi:hypothetical protein [Rhizobium sp. SSA_523]|uniref:hypothetical protein n=1 Tax=Rhizobium sp. SSA_523 TaxID=2952477 RepID=UPI0020918A48|nr:hypothetical protein [Rhizobium sp. SSA_523]MCO5730547.1 hypothetical protein [Rhizobium sp. SSA_523]WKC25584.1 hypothetical protein QTJ18_16635 [Rhizobium sp. SSA_523]
MSASKSIITAGLVALTFGVTATASAAEAHDTFWRGVAAGAVGGILGQTLVQGAAPDVYSEHRYIEPPIYIDPPPRSVIVRPTYYDEPVPPRPRCHYEWRENDWGDAYRVRVCLDE